MGVDVSVVGLGRVGLPLALVLADRGLSVIGIETDPERLGAVRAGRVPFREPGTQEVLDRVDLVLSDEISDAAAATHIVIAVGTQSNSPEEHDISGLRDVLDGLVPKLRMGHSIIIRSTVPPGTTDAVADHLGKRTSLEVDREIFVAHVPERISIGSFLDEIDLLPCIIGGVGPASCASAASLFETLEAPITHTTAVQAELAKVWSNVLRYTNFALPNLLMMDAELHRANVFEVIDLINRDYARGGIAAPGLTGGSCMDKNAAFAAERSAVPGLLHTVTHVHEAVPQFLIDGVRRRLGTLADTRVCVLGLAFKRDADDERGSPAHELIRLLELEGADTRAHDPLVFHDTGALESALEDADAVIVATDHTCFRAPQTLATIVEHASRRCIVVDPWDCWGAGQVFCDLSELSSRTRRPDGALDARRQAAR